MNTKPTAIILSDELTWPSVVLDCLNKHRDIFYLGKAILAGIEEGPFPTNYDKAHEELYKALLPFPLKGYHCTRLTESEILNIANNGMNLPDLDLLTRRIDALASCGTLTLEIANKLKTKNQANDQKRAGRLYFCFYPPKKAGNGVESFFRLWGGEALYGHHEEKDLEVGEVLRNIGRPCIIEADIPVSFLSQHSLLTDRTVNNFLKNRGCATNNYCDLVACSTKNISSSQIKKIFQFPDPDFIELSGCNDWDESLNIQNQKPLLLKLANQAVNHYRKKAEDEENLAMIIERNIHEIAEDIHEQISKKVELKSPSYLKSEIGKPKPVLEKHNITTIAENCVSLQSQLDSFNAKFIYENFKKACHTEYRFGSSEEARFAYLLENDNAVKCWMKPAPKQFEGLFYKKESENIPSNYEPDFVVELANEIILVEVKPENEMHDLDVLAKKQTAEKFCELISQNIGKFEIAKPWRYVIVPTNRIKITATIDVLLGFLDKN